MAEEHFVLRFAGEAVDEGRIDAKDLASSLLGMADLLRVVQAKDAELADEEPITLQVAATDDGSFDVQLILSALGNIWEVVRNVLTTDDVTAVANLGALLALAREVVDQLRQNGSKKVRKWEETDADTVLVTFTDGTTAAMGSRTFLVWEDRRAREAAQDLVQPLEREGVDLMEIKPSFGAPPQVTVRKDEVSNFDVPPQEAEHLDDEVDDTWLTLVNVGLTGGKKWRFYDGEREFNAQIEDADFLKAILDRIINFSSGDEARATVRRERYRTAKQIRSRYFVERITRVRRPGETAPLWPLGGSSAVDDPSES